MGEEILPARTFSRDKADKWDLLVAASSGALTAAVDALVGKDISLLEAEKWGTTKTNDVIRWVAEKAGYTGDKLSGADAFLEKKFKYNTDTLMHPYGGTKQHHLRDFSHHFSAYGLLCSIAAQFTGYSMGTNTSGQLVLIQLPKESIGNSPLDKLYLGTVNWLLHLVSDMGGSSSALAAREKPKENPNTVPKISPGTGIPGPILSYMKVTSSMPVVQALTGRDKNNNNNFSVVCSKLFNGTLLKAENEGPDTEGIKFDLRTEIGIAHEMLAKKQYIPVIINEVIVRAFYSVRRFLLCLEEQNVQSFDDLQLMDLVLCLPWKSSALNRMLVVSSASFVFTNFSATGIKAAIRSNGDKKKFAVDFIQGLNYAGGIRLILARDAEALNALHDRFTALADRLLRKVGLSSEEMTDLAAQAKRGFDMVKGMGTPFGFVPAAVFALQEVMKAIREDREATEERIRVEQQCKAHIETLLQYREELETAIAEYMESNLSVFLDTVGRMDNAMMSGDVDGYLNANADLQTHLGKKPSFANMRAFDEFMNSEDDFEL